MCFEPPNLIGISLMPIEPDIQMFQCHGWILRAFSWYGVVLWHRKYPEITFNPSCESWKNFRINKKANDGGILPPRTKFRRRCIIAQAWFLLFHHRTALGRRKYATKKKKSLTYARVRLLLTHRLGVKRSRSRSRTILLLESIRWH